MEFRLVLFRHGDSTMDGPTDHARSLSQVGRDQARSVTTQLAERGWGPGFCLSSTACRAEQTAEHLVALVPELAIRYEQALYLASPRVLSSFVAQAPAVQTLVLVGHNPGLSEFATFLSNTQVFLGTANAALLRQSALGWESSGDAEDCWELVDVLRPE